jgi:uncharacterized protein
MASRVVVDAGFLVALLSRRDHHHRWAAAQAARTPPPWTTCDAALSEAFHLVGASGLKALIALVRRTAVVPDFNLRAEADRVLQLMAKYAATPMSLADASLVRMTELLTEPLLLTTDVDFRVYRRHGRQTIPCSLPDVGVS